MLISLLAGFGHSRISPHVSLSNRYRKYQCMNELNLQKSITTAEKCSHARESNRPSVSTTHVGRCMYCKTHSSKNTEQAIYIFTLTHSRSPSRPARGRCNCPSTNEICYATERRALAFVRQQQTRQTSSHWSTHRAPIRPNCRLSQIMRKKSSNEEILNLSTWLRLRFFHQTE